ncbi:MAG: hypothetical protein ACQ9MH_10035 [Nitrospinales bacterium]
MKMHHLSEETVKLVLEKVKELTASGNFSPEMVEEIFALSEMDSKKFLESKNNPLQKEKVNFEVDPEQGIRFFDPFSFFTGGVYKDMDGWTVWTVDNLKEPWT